MYYDGNNPTTYPWGRFYLYQKNPYEPIHIRGYMKQMPPPASEHGFAINKNGYDWKNRNCSTAGPHWNPFNETHGEMNNMSYPSHVGNLKPIDDDGSGNAYYYEKAERPTLFGS